MNGLQVFHGKLQKASPLKVSCNQWNFVQMMQKIDKCKRISWRAPSSRRRYGNFKTTEKRRVNLFYSFYREKIGNRYMTWEKKYCVEMPIKFTQHQYKLALNDYHSCDRIMSHKTYKIWTNMNYSSKPYQSKV